MTNPVIPAEAVEAALEISLRQLGLWGKDLPRDLIEARRAQLTELLEAAAPHMLASVWDEAIEAHNAWTWDDENMDPLPNPYRTPDAR